MEKFYLAQDEDFFSVIDRIRRSRDNRIILIAPSGFSPLRSIINLKILKEESISLNKEIAIITADSLIKKLSRQVNVPIIESFKDDLEQDELERRRQLEFEKKLKSAPVAKRVVSDIRPKKAPKPLPRKFEEQKTEVKVAEPIEPIKEKKKIFYPGEEFRDLGDKEEHFDELFVKKEKKEKEEIYLPPEKMPSFKFFTFRRVVFILLILLVVGGGFFLYYYLPKAEILITTKKEPISFEAEIIADKNVNSINIEEGIVPAQIFQIETEESKTFPSTGEKEVSEKAKGKVIIYNQYSSSDQTLVKTTRLRSQDGKIFRLTESVVIPGATIEEGKIKPSSREVFVEADEPGEAYNIGPSKFTIPGFEGTPKYNSFYGESNTAMSGGVKGRVKVATQSDIDGAMQIVSIELQNRAKEEFLKKIPQDFKFLEGSQLLETLESSSSLKADQIGKEFTIHMKVRVWGAAIKEEDVIKIVKEGIQKKLSEEKFLIPSSIKLEYNKARVSSDKSKVSFLCSVEAEAGWNIDEKKLIKELAGKNEVEFRGYLSSLPEVDVTKVVFWPFWAKRIPNKENRIKIIIEGK